MIVDPDFSTHWKTKALANALGGMGPALQAILQLWGHCQQRKAWQFQLTPLRLAGICSWDGKADKLWEAMLELPLIKAVDGDLGWYEVHQWDERNSALIHNWGARCGGWDPKGGPPKKKPSKEGSKDKPKDRPGELPLEGSKDESKAQSIGLDKIREDKSTSENKASDKPRQERDLCFEMLVQIQGADLAELTKPMRGQINSALRSIREVMPDVTAEEIQRRAMSYRSKWPDVHLTANAIAKHWAVFSEKKEGPPPAGEADTPAEPPPPPLPDWPWRAVARLICEWVVVPPSDECWHELDLPVQKNVWRAWKNLSDEAQRKLREVEL